MAGAGRREELRYLIQNKMLVILSAAKNLFLAGAGRKQVLRYAQDDKSGWEVWGKR
jgi:hypothetical protein